MSHKRDFESSGIKADDSVCNNSDSKKMKNGLICQHLDHAFRTFAAKLISSLLKQKTQNLEDNQDAPSSSAVMISPLSIYLALGMTMAGARKTTLMQMLQGMSLLGSANEISEKEFMEWREEYFKKYIQKLMFLVKEEEISIANRLFVDQKMELADDYANFTKETFDSSVEPCSFTTDFENERCKINKWIETNTNHMIRDLIPVGGVTQHTDMVLANAIFFLGTWNEAFDVANTTKEVFHTLQSNKKKVSMMNKTSVNVQFGQDEEEQYRWVKLPYKNETFSMLFIVPHSELTIDNEKEFHDWLEQQLSSPNTVFQTYSEKLSKLSIPKFKLQCKLDLSSTLRDAPFNMTHAFNERNANFDGMTREALSQTLKNPPYLQSILHECVVEVDEQGTTAAAATAVARRRSKSKASSKEFVVNRPFAFLIMHEETIVFCGKVNSII
ncbi:hypothetical protein C9374_010358 [Naegleria lovaniensis]|uniref:Serpin domain-containing protein n=1 Tax=Naegleria lovaniensis TaxID=51637 RepID=A0AA88GI42_NAELO|nr:uncharacterized protein C9374_010358 [Naegleria lovaniensis]KAG2374984.1 hypothetical protein C9374_010358 [Naegleria lovaniensis]